MLELILIFFISFMIFIQELEAAWNFPCSHIHLIPFLMVINFIFLIDCRFFSSSRSYFQDQWEKYLKLRGILDGKSAPTFPKPYGVKERDQFYTSVSYQGWGGSSGHDAPMIAYDAILAAGDSWKELAHRAFFHGGDSDSTAAIAGCWWGVMYGFTAQAELVKNTSKYGNWKIHSNALRKTQKLRDQFKSKTEQTLMGKSYLDNVP